MILVVVISVLSLFQLWRWFPSFSFRKNGPAVESQCPAETCSNTGDSQPVGASDVGVVGSGCLPPGKEDGKPPLTEEEYDDMEDGLLGGLWNLNSALQFGQEYEWIYKLSENASLELGDAGLASLYNQASSLLTELCANILLKYSQFTAMDGYDDDHSKDMDATCGFRRQENDDSSLGAATCICRFDKGCMEGEGYGTPRSCESANCICFRVDASDWTEDCLRCKKRKVDPRRTDRIKGQDDKIAAVEPDEVNPGIEWALRQADVEAEKQRKLDVKRGFSYSAAGLLFPYYLGVSECLQEYNFLTEDTPLAGSSAGALVCAVVAGGIKMRDALEATKELGRECREGGTAFKLGSVLRAFLNKFLPDDAHRRANGRIRVSITQVFGSPMGLLVDQFDSKEDLLDALMASCHIPLYFASWPVTLFRNRICVDGGLTFFLPPTSAKHTVRISAFPGLPSSLRFGEVDISPDCNPSSKRPSLFQLVRWALVPAEDHYMEELFEHGYQDALVWCRKHQSTAKHQIGT